MSEPTEADREKARSLLSHAYCQAEECACNEDDEVEAIAAALAAAREEGRDSVGLGDFMPDPCGEETRAPNEHFRSYYGSWLECTKRAGHDGEHEHETSGLTWSTS